MTKMRNVWTVYNGQKYQSEAEALYAQKLDILARAGQIAYWDRPDPIVVDDVCLVCHAQPPDPCKDKRTGKPIKTIHRERMTLKPDFYVVPMGNERSYYVDVKGKGRVNKKTGKFWTSETAVFAIKARQWRKNIPFPLIVAYKDGTEKVIATGDEAIRARVAAMEK